MEQHNIADIISRLNSPDGKKLQELMKKDGGTAFIKAAAAAKYGNFQKAYDILMPILSDTDAEALAKKLVE